MARTMFIDNAEYTNKVRICQTSSSAADLCHCELARTCGGIELDEMLLYA